MTEVKLAALEMLRKHDLRCTLVCTVDHNTNLHEVGRVQYLTATDDEALAAFQLCARLEGIVPALESSHALARLPEVAGELGKDAIVVLNLSGRGDKDLDAVAPRLGLQL